MKRRLIQIVLIVTFIIFSWLGMQAVHEGGHVIMARITGGEVIKVALHPLIISRTDLGQNPHPLAVVWAGPVLGSLAPLIAFSLAAVCRCPGGYLVRFFAGFCLIANGVYIGVGWLLADGADPWVMTDNGSPRWLLVLFGLITIPAGFYLWHRQGPHFGLGPSKGTVRTSAAIVSTALLAGLISAEMLIGSR